MIVKEMDMKITTLFVILASLTLAFTGCSKRYQAASIPKNNYLGVIDVSSGKPCRRTLADGRTCIITPTVLSGENVSLSTRIDETNGTTKTLVFPALADGREFTFAFDKSTVITIALRK